LASHAVRSFPAESRPECSGAAFFADPYPTYARLRDRGCPVFDPTANTWLIARYAEVEAFLRETRVSKTVQRAAPTPFETSILFQNPPDHTRVRAILNQAFSGAAMQGLEDRVREAADSLIGHVQSSQTSDFIAAFAKPLPSLVIASLLGIPPADAGELHRLSAAFLVEEGVSWQETERRQTQAIQAMADYFRRLIGRRRRQPEPDVLSALIKAHHEGRLSNDELIGNCMLLMIAGHETTVNLLGNGLYLLLRHPDQLRLLEQKPELWPSAIEEILRFESPVQQGTFRTTTEPMDIAGAKLDAGSRVTAIIGSANRDPEQFPDPDRFDVTRTPNRHLAFGMGFHFCLGTSLARTEAKVGFARLFERLPNLRLASASSAPRHMRYLQSMLPWLEKGSSGLRWRTNAATRGLEKLNVRV
jgi:cytochrome P450